MLKPLVEDRLVALARRMIPCDALAVLRLEDDVLIPVVVDGLRGEATGRRFSPTEFPRLAEILKARGPVRFHDVTTPDPFDGLFADCGDELSRPHACMGCPVVVEDQTIGVITFDALDPTAFDRVADDTVAMLADLAGATIHTCELSTTHICAGALGVSKSGSGRAVTRTRYTRGGPGRVRTEAHRNR